jgi:hypothetical protein
MKDIQNGDRVVVGVLTPEGNILNRKAKVLSVLDGQVFVAFSKESEPVMVDESAVFGLYRYLDGQREAAFPLFGIGSESYK